jgi:hypothetical protein
MARVTDPDLDLDLYERQPHSSRDTLILRVEPVRSAAGDWGYRASYPELRGVSATAPKVLDAILAAEAKLSRYLDEDSA